MKTKRARVTNTSWENDKAPAAPAVTSSSFVPSPHQQAYFDWISKGTGNASVIAVAGAGKTTTLLHGTFYMPKGATGYAVVFNKKNADEMRAKFPAHVQCGTFHSFWMKACRDKLGNNVQVDERKTARMIEQVLPCETVERYGTLRKFVTWKFKDYVPLITKLIGLAKNSGVGLLLPDTAGTYIDLIDVYDIEIADNIDVEKLIDYTQRVLELSVSTTNVIDFNDMLYLPLIKGWTIPRRDFVFVDEAQDTNAVQRELVKRMATSKTGRTIWVGDPHQAIYGFRGATNDAMAIITKQFNTKELPLTVSFRCPRAVVKYAQTYVSHITSHDTAPEGSITRVQGKIDKSILNSSTSIVCRTTAPLVSLAFKLISNRIPCTILGRDIGTRLRELVERMKASSLATLTAKLETYRAREIERATIKEDDAKVRAINDQIDSLESIIQSLPDYASVATLVQEIDMLFSDNVTSMKVTLCTVHKAKGLEWTNVVIIRPDLLPLPWVRKQWQQQQETNLAYVAATRAKSNLIIVEGTEITLADKADLTPA